MNTHDPEVGAGADGGEDIQTIAEALQSLANDETLIVRAGKLLGKTQSFTASPRVLILNEARLVPFHSLEDRAAQQRLGSILLGESAAAAWTSAGAQTALATAFTTLACAAQKHFATSLEGKFVVSGGLGTLGGVLPLASTMNGAAFLGVEVDEARIQARIRAGFCDICVNDLDEGLRILKNAIRKKEPVSVGLVGNCAEVIPEMARRGVLPDILTDMTPAIDLSGGYFPAGMSVQQAGNLARVDPQAFRKRVEESTARHAAGLLALQKLGAVVFDSGNGRGGPSIPHFVPAYLEPSIHAGVMPLRWFALSGERSDILKLDDVLLAIAPQNEILTRWLRAARKNMRFQGLPARAGWLGAQEREEFGERLTGLVAHGEVRAPVVLARECFNSSAISLPAAEGQSESSVQRIFDALRDAAPGASWASWERVGDKISLTTRAIVVDGTEGAARRLGQVLSSGLEPA